jgi:hypothetical protein
MAAAGELKKIMGAVNVLKKTSFWKEMQRGTKINL